MRAGLHSTWPLVRLDSLAEVRTGIAKNENAPDRSASRPYLRVANVQAGHLDLSEVKHIAVAEGDIERYELREGDVLMTEGGDFDKLGRGTIWRGEVPGCLHQNHVFAVRTDPARLLPEFLALLAESDHGRSYFLRSSKQSTNLASINSTQLRAFPVPAAPLAAQREIVRVHRSVVAAQRATAQLAEAKRRLKRALLQQLLSDASRHGDGLAPWRRVALADVAYEIANRNGGRLGADRVMGVLKHEGLVPMRERTMADDLSRYKVVPPRAFAYNPMRINIGSIAHSWHKHDVLVSPDYEVFATRPDRLDPRYLDHVRRSEAWASFVKRTGNGSVRVRIYYQDLGQFVFPLPPLREQQRIAALLDKLDHEIALLERQLAAYRQLKRGLMQTLLTGDISHPTTKGSTAGFYCHD